MEDLKILGSKMKFATTLSKKDNFFSISGTSRPDDAHTYFKPITDWFEEYSKNPNKETILNLNFSYLNTSSTKKTFLLFKQLNKYFINGMNIKIVWQYHEDDPDMLEAGKDFSELVDLPFEFLCIDE